MPRPSTAIDWSVAPWEELAATGDELLTVLDDERDALLGRDPVALERTVERKLAVLSSIETMLRAHAARRLQAHGPDILTARSCGARPCRGRCSAARAAAGWPGISPATEPGARGCRSPERAYPP